MKRVILLCCQGPLPRMQIVRLSITWPFRTQSPCSNSIQMQRQETSCCLKTNESTNRMLLWQVSAQRKAKKKSRKRIERSFLTNQTSSAKIREIHNDLQQYPLFMPTFKNSQNFLVVWPVVWYHTMSEGTILFRVKVRMQGNKWSLIPLGRFKYTCVCTVDYSFRFTLSNNICSSILELLYNEPRPKTCN